MKLSTTKKIIEAMETAGIKVWDAIVDTAPTHLYNNDTQFNVLDEAEETLINFAPSIPNIDPFGYNNIVVKHTDLSDVHEIRLGGTLEEIKKFVEAYGIVLEDDQLDILIKINSKNYNLKPVTGDYLTFEKLSEEEVAALSEEERADYEKALKSFESRNKPTRNVQVTV